MIDDWMIDVNEWHDYIIGVRERSYQAYTKAADPWAGTWWISPSKGLTKLGKHRLNGWEMLGMKILPAKYIRVGRLRGSFLSKMGDGNITSKLWVESLKPTIYGRRWYSQHYSRGLFETCGKPWIQRLIHFITIEMAMDWWHTGYQTLIHIGAWRLWRMTYHTRDFFTRGYEIFEGWSTCEYWLKLIWSNVK